VRESACQLMKIAATRPNEGLIKGGRACCNLVFFELVFHCLPTEQNRCDTAWRTTSTETSTYQPATRRQ
jgi:hypothetical protein